MLCTEEGVFGEESDGFRWVCIGIEVGFRVDLKCRFQLTNKSKEELFALQEKTCLAPETLPATHVFDDCVDELLYTTAIGRLFVIVSEPFDNGVEARFPQLCVETLR